MNLEHIKSHVESIMERFPTVTAVVKRPTVNAYNERTGACTTLATLTGWLKKPDPRSYEVRKSGITFDEDNDKWLCVMYDASLPAVRHGDIVTIGGVDYEVRNTVNAINIRVYWQLAKA